MNAPVPEPDLPIHRVFDLGPGAGLAEIEQAETTVAWLAAGWELSPALTEAAYDHLARLRYRLIYRNATV